MEEIKKRLTPIKAIRAKCLDCSAGSFIEAKECPVTDCPLYAYRMGHRPPKTPVSIQDEDIPVDDVQGEI